jgi:hypothetical protein
LLAQKKYTKIEAALERRVLFLVGSRSTGP